MLGRKARDYILYTVGPVEMFDRTLKVRSRPIPYFRKELTKRGFELPKFTMSNAVTMFFTPNNSAHDLKEYLASKGLFINPSSGKWADSAVRVAHIGDLIKEDYDLLLQEIDNYYKK